MIETESNRETMQEHECPIASMSGMDVLGAWALAAAVLLGLLVLSVF